MAINFWNSVQKTGNCWNWLRGTCSSGYGEIVINKTYWLTHRYSWYLKNGKIPKGLCVLHTCDNRKCVNPKHLFLGTKKDNAVDRKNKGRGCRGEKHHSNKLTEKQVRSIKQSHDTNRTALARKLGVSQPLISDIINNKVWSWL